MAKSPANASVTSNGTSGELKPRDLRPPSFLSQEQRCQRQIVFDLRHHENCPGFVLASDNAELAMTVPHWNTASEEARNSRGAVNYYLYAQVASGGLVDFP